MKLPPLSLCFFLFRQKNPLGLSLQSNLQSLYSFHQSKDSLPKGVEGCWSDDGCSKVCSISSCADEGVGEGDVVVVSAI
ncbi:hypothetical protein Tco_1364203, partial [Tanacetum coccineum]